MQKTAEITREWHIIDVKGKVLGRVATEIATKLIGKHKPTFTPHMDGGDYVVVINAAEVKVTGNKGADKIYYSYSGYPGGLSQRTFDEQQEKHPELVIEKAVYNMIPKNKLRQHRMARLKIYAGTDHPHSSQLGSE
ncbi:MAG: 50S ribosomal protein L13 [bacterium]|nr:50S ribosomal protein L13 [bacterium]